MKARLLILRPPRDLCHRNKFDGGLIFMFRATNTPTHKTMQDLIDNLIICFVKHGFHNFPPKLGILYIKMNGLKN